jgi:hypothetical protein
MKIILYLNTRSSRQGGDVNTVAHDTLTLGQYVTQQCKLQQRKLQKPLDRDWIDDRIKFCNEVRFLS